MSAANRIKNEDLTTPLIYEGNDEFKDVTTSFEEMRTRLLDTLNKQIKSEENRKELLSNISHDLKTPITTIKGYVEGINDGIAGSPEKLQKYLDTIHKKSILMDQMIDSLFLYSKLDLNRVQFNFREINLSSFLKDICDDMQFNHPEVEIRYDPPHQTLVIADVIHLHRVVSNLIDNAIKYRSEARPLIQISVLQEKLSASVKISDNGRGIASEDLIHIFDRFYRADRARSSEIEGSGLGLAISKQIIESHGGIIKAQPSPSGGTEIIFSLRTAI